MAHLLFRNSNWYWFGYIVAVIMGAFIPTTFMYTDPSAGVISKVTKAWVLNWDKAAQASWISLPKLVASISIMPQSVLGGASAMLFASIAVSGMQIISKSHFTARSFTIVAVAIGVGYGVGANSNLVLPKDKADKDVEEAERSANAAG